jgi:hypothetical protein
VFSSTQELLASNMAQNLQLVVQIAKEYTEQLGADKIIALLEGVNSYNGLYYYLGAYLAFSEDPEVCGVFGLALQDVHDTIIKSHWEPGAEFKACNWV